MISRSKNVYRHIPVPEPVIRPVQEAVVPGGRGIVPPLIMSAVPLPPVRVKLLPQVLAVPVRPLTPKVSW